MRFQADKFIKPVVTIAPQTLNNSAVTGDAVDTLGSVEALVTVHFGAMAAGASVAYKVQETSDDPASPGTPLAGSWADLADANAQDPAMTATFTTALAAVAANKNYTKRLNLGPRKRYLRVYAIEGATQNALIEASIILVLKQPAPFAQTQTTQP
jgi:hypothetical protein